jgi:hypothetical protein
MDGKAISVFMEEMIWLSELMTGDIGTKPGP